MRPSHLPNLTSVTKNLTKIQTKRPLTTLTPKMSAPGIPSSTAGLQAQSEAQTQIPSAQAGLKTPAAGMSTYTSAPGAAAGGIGAGGAGLGGSGGEGEGEYGITSEVKTAPGVELSSRQRVLVGSVLDVSILTFCHKLPFVYFFLDEEFGERRGNT